MQMKESRKAKINKEVGDNVWPERCSSGHCFGKTCCPLMLLKCRLVGTVPALDQGNIKGGYLWKS